MPSMLTGLVGLKFMLVELLESIVEVLIQLEV
jgi:hypothetical protein